MSLVSRIEQPKTYRYEARTDDGVLVSGVVQASSESEAGEALAQKGMFPVRVNPVAFTWQLRRFSGSGRSQVAWQIWQLASMVEAGMSVTEGLDCLARQMTGSSLGLVFTDVSRRVREGESLSNAMGAYPATFPASLVAMIRASELSGTLGSVLRQSSQYLIKDKQVLDQIRAAMVYPAFMGGLCLAIILVLMTFVLPKFADVFAQQGAVLPAPTRILLGLSEALTGSWYLWLLGVAAIAVGGVWYVRTPKGRQAIDTAVVTLPGVASLFNTMHQSRVFRTLAMLLRSHVSLIDSIHVVRTMVPNGRYRALWTELEQLVQTGGRVSPPLFASDFVDESVAQMVDVGDRSGTLEASFGHLADFMEERFNRCIRSTIQMIEPVMILVMGGVVAFVAISMMLPLFNAARMTAH